jgi:hypothetical protein
MMAANVRRTAPPPISDDAEPTDDREAHLFLKVPPDLAKQLRERLQADADPQLSLIFRGAHTPPW